jgi:short-subunit dehydrogenase
LHGKQIAAVTGASRGIGRAAVEELAQRGYRVFALARSEDDLNRLAAEMSSAGMDVNPVVLDIADDASRAAAVGAIMRATGGYGVDVLVNNAGFGQFGPLEEIPVEALRRQFDVNVCGLFAFTQPFLPGMRQRRCGWIVNVSSAAGRIATPFMGAYNGSKFALEGMSDALRLELAPFGVHVVLIEPGPIRTAFDQAARTSSQEDPSSPYAPFVANWRRARGTSDLFERSPESVARIIGRAVQLNHPRPRYTITPQAKFAGLARRFAPDVVVDWALRRAMGLNRLR